MHIIHANWPAYPDGEGVADMLLSIAKFGDPDLVPIDFIDQVTLFVVDPIKDKDEFDEEQSHVALWDEDIAAMVQKGYLMGATVAHEALGVTTIEYGPDQCVNLTFDGLHAIKVYQVQRRIDSRVFDRVKELLLARHYDAAVRDAMIMLEKRLRQLASSDKGYGKGLIKECFGGQGKVVLGDSSLDRSEIQKRFDELFTNYRNPYAHDFVDDDLPVIASILERASALLAILDRCQ